ncbi:hypothetical protein FRC09_008883 [Ceratobasidium sp. 395]|nr:hypothetical protein FRC09_008883 [Ceratobasidium sp. 395]
MLHELTHNVHGPHDEKFYSFLNKLEDEYHALVTGGWRGTGFFAPGDKLGSRNTGLRGTEGAFSRFDTTGKRKAIEAAEARRRVEALGSGGRLGGPRVASQSGKTRQELAAEAAERRRLDEQLCAASHPSADREAARAAADSIAEVVADADLAEALALSNALAESTADIRATPSSSAGPSGSRVQVAETHKTEDEVIEIDSDSDEERDNILSRSPAARELQCPKCTYMNPPTTLEHHCVMCGAQLVAPFGVYAPSKTNLGLKGVKLAISLRIGETGPLCEGGKRVRRFDRGRKVSDLPPVHGPASYALLLMCVHREYVLCAKHRAR